MTGIPESPGAAAHPSLLKLSFIGGIHESGARLV